MICNGRIFVGLARCWKYQVVVVGKKRKVDGFYQWILWLVTVMVLWLFFSLACGCVWSINNEWSCRRERSLVLHMVDYHTANKQQ